MLIAANRILYVNMNILQNCLNDHLNFLILMMREMLTHFEMFRIICTTNEDNFNIGSIQICVIEF